MKSKRFRMISLVLVLVLALQFVPVASAASISARYDFTEEELEYAGYAIVRRYDRETHLWDYRVGGTTKHHTSGTQTIYPAKTYTLDYMSSAMASDFYPALEAAASDLGVNFYFRYAEYVDEIVIPKEEATGYYYLTTDYYGYHGSYDVFVEFGDVEELWDSGIYDMAANRCYGITGYFRLSD